VTPNPTLINLFKFLEGRKTIMERAPVSSSTIAAIGYDPDSGVLEVEFTKGAVYSYSGVPLGEYEGLMSADSKGKYLNANVKGRYPYAKL
jgi:KTSC domain